MASHIGTLSEEQLQCSLCLCVFTDPVCTPCGHSFCLICILNYWESSQQFQCPHCKEVFPRRPRLSVNVLLSKLTHPFRRSGLKKVEICKEPFRTPHSATTGLVTGRTLLLLCTLMVVIGYTVHLCQGTSPTRLAELCEQRMVSQKLETMMTTDEKTEKMTHVSERNMRMAFANLDKKLHNLSNMVKFLMKNMLGTRMTMTKLEEVFEKMPVPQREMKRILHYAVDVTLDPDTAHPNLVLSSDGKQLWLGHTPQNLTDYSKRFDYCVSVLGKEGFSSGRFYYKVQVKGKTDWDIGVAKESVNRKGRIVLTPAAGFWTIWLRNGSEYAALEQPFVPISLRDRPQTVGVFVDYEEGLVSFYDGDSGTHLYSFTGFAFTETLYPYLSPSLNSGGKNSAPLIIPRLP